MKVAAGITVATVSLLLGLAYSRTREELTVQVADNYIRTNEKTSKKMVVTTRGETYQVEDSLIGGTMHSANTYAALIQQKNTDVCITKIGWRVPVLSLFPNIVDARFGPCTGG